MTSPSEEELTRILNEQAERAKDTEIHLLMAHDVARRREDVVESPEPPYAVWAYIHYDAHRKRQFSPGNEHEHAPGDAL